MKTIIGVLIIGLLIILAGVASTNLLDTQAEGLFRDLASMEKSVENENWSSALQLNRQFTQKWDQSKKTWSMLIDHIEIDSINISLSELESYLKEKEKSDALSRISVLKILIKHIPDKESFKLKNIL